MIILYKLTQIALSAGDSRAKFRYKQVNLDNTWAIGLMVQYRKNKLRAMQKKITNKDQFFNNINLTVDDDVYVGIDGHKNTCHLAGQNQRGGLCCPGISQT